MKQALHILFIVLFASLADAQVRILVPNGGERIRVGSNAVITWTGTQPNDIVTIEYSYDAGVTWNTITNNATGGLYRWNNVPNTPSTQCLLRITTRPSLTDSIITLSTWDGTTSEGISFADFSPDGTYVLGSGIEGNLYIWNSYTKQVVQKIRVADRTQVTSMIDILSIARFSPDGNYIATLTPIDGDPGNQVYLYDAKTYQLLRSWKHTNFGTNMNSTRCNFSPDSRSLVVCGNMHPVVYNVNDGSIAARFHGYYDSVKVSGGWNYFIWKILDGWWTKDMTRFAGVMTNGSPRALVLNNAITQDTIYTHEAHLGAMSTHSIHINPSGTRIMTTAGDGNLIVNDLSTGAVVTTMRPYLMYPICAEYDHSGKTFVTSGYDRFGANGGKLMLFDAATNTYIRDVGTLGAVGNVQFNFDDTRILVSSGSSAVIFQTPTAMSQTDLSDSLWTIYFDVNNTVTVSIPDLSAQMNERVDVPISISDPVSARFAGATKIDMTIRYNVTMLAPTGSTPLGTVTNLYRTIPLSLPMPMTDDTVITVLPMIAALGNDSVTSIDIVGLSTDAPSLNVLWRNGSFRLEDICYEGGARLLNPDGITSITAVHPNPTSSTVAIRLRTIEEGMIRLNIYDAMGRSVRTLLDNWYHPIDNVMEYDVSELPQGRYFIRLETPTVVRTKPLIISR